MDAVDLGRVRQLLDVRAAQQWQGLHMCPRTCPSPRAQLCTYHWCFVRPFLAPSALPHHAARLRCSAGPLRGVLPFGAGCHGLPVDVGRGTGVPRRQCVCTKCHGQAVCDEQHVVFECLALQHLRDKYSCCQGLFRLRSSSCSSLILWVCCIMSETVFWCCWLMVRVVMSNLISPDVAGTDARVIHSCICAVQCFLQRHLSRVCPILRQA